MDAIQKIEAALKKMPGDGSWRPEHRDALNEWRALMNEATIREVLQTLASKEAELAEAGLKYVSLFGELQNAMGEIQKLKESAAELLAAYEAPYPAFEAGVAAQEAWSMRLENAVDSVRALTTTPQPTE